MAKDVIIIPESGSLIFSGSTSPLSSSFVSNNSGSLTLYLEKTGNQSFAIEGSGSTLFSINGSIGQLFSVTDSLSGSLFAVSDVSGLPILEVFSNDTVKMGTFNNEAIVVSGSHATIKTLDVSSSLTASSVKAGDNSNYLQVSSTGDLTLNGTADYLVGANRYAFRFIGDEDFGLYFNLTDGRYEFRNGVASPIFSIGAVNGNTNIEGTLSIPGFSNVSASLAAAVAGGDNLGNHTATQDLNMGGNDITDVGDVDGVDLSTLNSTVSTNTLGIASLTAATSSYLTSETYTGTVDTTGTPANNQIAIFTDSDTIKGDPNLTWTGVILDIGSNGGIATFNLSNNITFNNDNDDMYFQVKGSGDDNLLQVNPQLNDKVGIGTSTPSEKLTVEGNVSASGNLLIQGSTNILTSLTASGLNYPDTDGLDRQVMKTDGNGNLSFGYAENVEISVKNVSGGSIPKGTPCYITASGTSGNTAGIIPSDASDISTMPAGVIAGETLANEAEGVGLINGFIQGVDTSAFTSGDTVYVAVGGGYTNVKPTGSGVYIQKLGNVEKVDNTNGSGVINGPGYYNDLPNWETGKIMVGTDTYPATSSLITLDENGSNLIINGTLSGSGGSQLNLDLYEFGYEITTSFPITGSGLIVSSSNLPANHYNMVKIGETELLDLNTALTPNTFFIHNVDNFIVASGSEPVNVYGEGPGKLFEHTGDEFKIYAKDSLKLTISSGSSEFTNPIKTNQITTAAPSASSPQYVAVWETSPSAIPTVIKYITASTFTGGGGGSTTLGGLNDVTITSVTDGDLLRYNGTATEWQNTNLGLSLTPTLSIESDFYFPGSATITNYASYSAPSIFAEVKLDGNVLVPNENISRDGSGNLTWADPSGSLNTGSRVLEVQVQDFGDLASEITTGSYTVSEASFRYIRFETTTASNHTYVREFRVYTDGGQSGTAYPPDMTSDTAPSPYVASSSGAYTSTYAAFKAFDNNPTSTGWWNLAQSPYSGDWVQIDFGSAITFKSIQLIINPSYSGFSVGTIYASNSGSFTGEEITLATFDNSLNTINIG